ncbi:thiol:disulfide interchange protein DsbA/DsbL [Aliikangiella coralliicola]|uniref:thiol:disulfide interchange protein DsbA/DsbL n=1 Tax=Aliikangiella coralliicola TaxID=2592383 RepID=UPI00143CCA85|nr:thiol:disulfide interchange protein DsbA/DsbL [Aliikangiella coralliicola]
MKHFSIVKLFIVISVLILASCQAEESKDASGSETSQSKAAATKEQPKQADATPKVAEAEKPQADHHGHAHSGDGHEHQAKVQPGEKYQKVEPQFECSEPVVVEFFAYHCPHCNDLEPAAEAWRKQNADKVKFVSIPTTLGHQQLGSMVLVHHAAKMLGVLEKTQPALFERFHKEKKLFASPEEAAEFLAAQGADKAKALETLQNQDALTKSIEADFELLQKYKISSVPQVLVNHQYMTNITAAGGHDEVFKVVDETLKLENGCKTK